MTFVPSAQQQALFDWVSDGTGSAIVEAVAGAGKTTSVVKALSRMEGSVTLLAYNKKMALELQERTSDMPNVKASTFHGIGFSALRYAFGKQHQLKLDGNKCKDILTALLAERQEEHLKDLTQCVLGLVGMAKQRGLGALSPLADEASWYDMASHFALDDSLPEERPQALPICIRLAIEVLRRSNDVLGIIDYDDMVYLPLQRRLRLFQSDWVIVDEAQDTNPTRRALAQRMLKAGGRLVAVGDPHQAIYGFTGTDNDSLEQIARTFDCIRLPLTVSYRCPRAVVAVARHFVGHIEAHESAPEGEVLSYDYADLLQHVRPGDAILCRYNKYLVSTAFYLIRQGVPAKIEGRNIGHGLAKLAGRWKRVTTLNGLESKLEEYETRECAKAVAKDDARREEEVKDLVDTLRVVIERARELGYSTVSELQDMVVGLFADDASSPRVVTLCSGHRSKGLEWERVHILGLQEVQPGRTSRAWQALQEINLQYVEVTRAKSVLHLVFGIQRERRSQAA
jgi:DNA helicase-2/ATP-dependent DNA helicase PcrA